MVNSTESILYSNCDPNLPSEVCAFANVCGLIDAVLWFLNYLPQIYRNFRHKSVKGLSPIWIIGGFTSSINYVFFVFKWGTLPLYAVIGGVYTPVLQAILLLQIFIFTPFSRKKMVVSCLCLIVWLIFILLQTFLSIYDYLIWITVIWVSIGSYPQIIMNMERQSTLGLSVIMICLRTNSIIMWFICTYLLLLPVQFVLFCYFGGTGSLILTLQVIYYWKRLPRSESVSEKSLEANINNIEVKKEEEEEEENLDKMTLSSTCNIIRLVLAICTLVCLFGFIVAVIWRLNTFIILVAPFGIVVILLCFHVYFTTCCGQLVRTKLKRLFSCQLTNDLITVRQ